jgi:iron complex transport system substrate-binding protein
VSIIVLGFLAAACGSAAPAAPGTSSSGASFPVTIRATGGPVTIPAKPARIVSLSPTSTEILFAIGAGSQVIAVDDRSNFPAAAPKTALSGFEPNIEAVAAYRPDLVVFAEDTKGLGDALRRLAIPALLHPAAKVIADTYAQISELGIATGHRQEAAGLARRMQKRIGDIVAAAPRFDTPPTYYHELDGSYFSATSSTFIGTIYSLLGLRNIADPADKQSSGYPQLSPEFIVAADPALIFLADTKCCSQTPASVAARPGWSGISAVKTGSIVTLDDDVASRWGPRIVDFLQTVADALRALKRAA